MNRFEFEPSRKFSAQKMSHLRNKARNQDFEPFRGSAIPKSYAYDCTLYPSMTFEVQAVDKQKIFDLIGNIRPSELL